MTEQKLIELQLLSATLSQLNALNRALNEEDYMRTVISTDCEDVTFTEMIIDMYPDFRADFAKFIYEQYHKYKEAFDNA